MRTFYYMSLLTKLLILSGQKYCSVTRNCYSKMLHVCSVNPVVLSSNEASLLNVCLAEYDFFLRRFHKRNLIFLQNASSVNFLCIHAFFVSSCNAHPDIK